MASGCSLFFFLNFFFFFILLYCKFLSSNLHGGRPFHSGNNCWFPPSVLRKKRKFLISPWKYTFLRAGFFASYKSLIVSCFACFTIFRAHGWILIIFALFDNQAFTCKAINGYIINFFIRYTLNLSSCWIFSLVDVNVGVNNFLILD